MKLRILKKKYKKMYGKKPPEQMKEKIIKSMIRQSEYIKIKAIDQNAKEYCTRVGTAEIKKVLLALIKAVRKENQEYLNGHSMEDTINSQIVKANWLNS